MKWLPSFRNLFLVFILGLALFFGGTIGQISSTWNSTAFVVFQNVRLLGLLLMVIIPLLMGLKFFSRLDQKS
jgi:hypothetical protein